MAIKTRETTADGVTNNGAPLTNAELDNNFVELQQNKADLSGANFTGDIDVTGTITFDGGTTSADLNFGDDDKAIFGASSDLQIYHDTANNISVIEDVGSGILSIRGSSNIDFANSANTKYYARFIDAGATSLYYDGSQKLATTNTGIDVTGTVTADGLTVDAASVVAVRNAGTAELKIHGNVNSSAAVPTLSFIRGSGDVAFADAYTDHQFFAQSGSLYLRSGESSTSRINAVFQASGDVGFYEPTGSNIRINYDASTEFVVNEDSADFDFRVESDTRSHALFVDASKNGGSVAIGTDTSTAWAGNGHLDFRYGGLGDDGSGYIDLTCNLYNSTGTNQAIKTGGLGGSMIRMAFGAAFIYSTNSTTADADATLVQNFGASTSGSVFNEDSLDQDFRVESNNNSNMLFVDGGKDKVVIGSSSSPSVSGSSPRTYDLVVDNGIAIGNGAYTHGYVGTGGTDGNVVITSNSYPANTGSERSVIISTGTSGGGGPNELARFAGDTGVIINEGGIDRDFRVESNNYTDMIFVDGGNNTVNFGSSGFSGGNHTALAYSSSRTKLPFSARGPNSNGCTLFGDYYVSDESQMTISLGYSNANVIIGRGITGGYPVVNTYVSTQDTYNMDHAAAIVYDGGFEVKTAGSSSTVTTGNTVPLFSRFTVGTGGAVFNDTSHDADFRVESDSNSNMLFVDAGNNRVGIGTGSPSGKFHVSDSGIVNVVVTSTNSRAGLALEHAGTTVGAMHSASGALVFGYGAAWASNEAMRIDSSSGNVLVGRTSNYGGAYLQLGTSTSTITKPRLYIIGYRNSSFYGEGIKFLAGSDVGAIACNFHNSGGTAVGSITTGSSSTAYNTSSDYRLKEDWQPMSGSIDRVKALNPVNFAWISSGERVDGFLAHEAQEVVPEAVTGTKDAVDAEGNPDYQGIDQSKLVPLLTSALQEAIARIEALEAQLNP